MAYKLIFLIFIFIANISYSNIIYDKNNIVITDIEIENYISLYENNNEIKITKNISLLTNMEFIATSFKDSILDEGKQITTGYDGNTVYNGDAYSSEKYNLQNTVSKSKSIYLNLYLYLYMLAFACYVPSEDRLFGQFLALSFALSLHPYSSPLVQAVTSSRSSVSKSSLV